MMRFVQSRLMLIALCIGILVIMEVQQNVEGNPAIFGTDLMGVCIRNCAQCKKMYGQWFQGQSCADNCVRLNGRVIPDCEDVDSIAPYINKLGIN